MKAHIEFTRSAVVVPPAPKSLREIGACVEFRGIVRGSENGRKISALNYEAYDLMARTQLKRMMGDLNATHPCEEIYFIHRLGEVPVGETSLYLRVLSKHRGEAFQFASGLIARLKADVPIWKTVPPVSE